MLAMPDIITTQKLSRGENDSFIVLAQTVYLL